MKTMFIDSLFLILEGMDGWAIFWIVFGVLFGPLAVLGITLLLVYALLKDEGIHLRGSRVTGWRERANQRKGHEFEQQVSHLLEKLTDPMNLYPSIYLRKKDGRLTEIDCVLVHPTGIYAFETKNRGGEIFGNAHEDRWTNTIGHYNVTTRRFYNPIKQNERHVELLSEYLDVDKDLINNVVVFSDRCNLLVKGNDRPRTAVLQYSRLSAYLEEKLCKSPTVFSSEDIDEFREALEDTPVPDDEELEEHVLEVHEAKENALLEDKMAKEGLRCPKCGNRLVVRTHRQGEKAGKRFVGCSAYPACRYKKDLD